MTKSKEALQLLSECANGETKLVFTQCLDLEKTIKKDLDKLNQYTQLEKELGIDLFILFKALKNGVYVKNEYAYDYYEIEYKKVRGIEKTGLSAISNICEFPECDEILCYSNYGKFWALTREELEDE